MTEVKEFTPVLMYVDHEKIDVLMKSAKETEERINNGLSQLETFLGNEIDDQERLSLLKNGGAYLHQKIKEQFQFPNASDQFNLESMGKVEEYEQMKKVLSNIWAAFQSFNFAVEDGKVFLSEEGKEAIITKNTHSTQNDAQTQAFKLAEKLSKDLNKAVEKNWIGNFEVEQVKRGILIINTQGKNFVPNYRKISVMRSDGSVSMY